ncbi:shikimate kinase AroK [Oceanicoccus sp. KOV_DT_Chl]|uniref:shikimate kinase AroK n=1 Tax=Oceanicoccus sp. KOV_DT_Chl TaxID=1904639 RepID=UPI000C7CF5E6|nr:shikimate kinase AroK [Oceanicoccus sp. KOV_DT_Chl]
MGAGKSTIGRLLAADLRLEFKDTDKEIEDRSGVDIPWIFDMEGEEGFRNREAAMLDELSQLDKTLLATGGGIVLMPENRRVLSSRGRVVYLMTSIEEQVRRTARDTKRPLLNSDNPKQVLTDLMTQRHELYQEIADYVIDTDRRSPKSVAQELAEMLSGI